MGAGTLVAGTGLGRGGAQARHHRLHRALHRGAVLAAVSTSIEVLLAARVIQGLGAAGPSGSSSMALVRDLYEGRAMARIMSFVMMVFVMIPSVAPLIGALIIAGFGLARHLRAFVLFGIAGRSG
jgi:MFS transporter, DHA1 family, multidrug resistance protein